MTRSHNKANARVQGGHRTAGHARTANHVRDGDCAVAGSHCGAGQEQAATQIGRLKCSICSRTFLDGSVSRKNALICFETTVPPGAVFFGG